MKIARLFAPWAGLTLALGLAGVPACPAWAEGAPPRLKVSENHRFLVYEDGRPFFYLGDTAWELFHRLNREEADRYLENRAGRASPSSRPWPSPNSTGSATRTPTATCRWSTTTPRGRT